MVSLDWIKEHVRAGEYYFSKHADEERQNDSLTFREIEEALLSGILLEQYEDTGRGESCLVAGYTKLGKPVHIVCGRRGEWPVMITVYIPKPPKFINPLERG